MKIGIFGKFPPIQGGVSARTYWTAHALAGLGHEVFVVTDAREATAPYRMHMRPEDWVRCDAQYGSGSVKVHWTESYGKQEWRIPNSTSHVTKLASIGLRVAREHRLDLIYSHYLEPYSVAAHLVAQTMGLPHIVRTAGSDAGRLWLLPQYQGLYDEILAAAEAIICSPGVASKMAAVAGPAAQVISTPGKHENLSDLFSPGGPVLDIESLEQEATAHCGTEFHQQFYGTFDPSRQYVGVYGKLGKDKGTFALLAALKSMKSAGRRVGLLVMAHERPSAQHRFRDLVQDYGLQDAIVQIPFLPHWRVPDFIRACIAVCCLEQNFPIKFHDPVVAREVMLCGGCLIASAELIGKMPDSSRLVDRRNCMILDDARDVQSLEAGLAWVFENPALARHIGGEARRYAVDVTPAHGFARELAGVVAGIVARRRGLSVEAAAPSVSHARYAQ